MRESSSQSFSLGTTGTFIRLAALAFVLVFSVPVLAVDDSIAVPPADSQPQPLIPQTQTPDAQPQPQAQPQEQTETPEAKAPAKHHAASHKHKKKSAHKKSKAKHHKKPAKKKPAAHHRKPVKKKTPPKEKAVEAKPETLAPVEAETVKPAPAEPETAKAAPVEKETVKKKLSAFKEKAAAVKAKVAEKAKKVTAPLTAKIQEMRASGAGGPTRTVAYNFCLGYDNCVPHRYEAVMQGNRVGSSRVLEKAPDGSWNAGKIDPVMASDLAKMAAADPNSGERELTEQEKARIADHQGKMHVELIDDANAGEAGKEKTKAMLRDMNITNLGELNAYDPKLAENPGAVAAVNELASERAKDGRSSAPAL